MDAFFTSDRAEFFSPLNGKYREAVVACIRSLYVALNGPEADYSYHLKRDDVIEIFAKSIRDAPVLESADNDDNTQPLSLQDRASATLRRLKETGWIEEYLDTQQLVSAFRFTGHGRRFASLFASSESEIITKTQNTRSTLSHLQSFITKIQEGVISIDYLMIAANLSGEIVLDFNMNIEEIVEQRRALVASADQQIQEAKQAGESFFEFMERRFVPDMEIKFSRDSVERYRGDILDLIENIRALPNGLKVDVETQIRQQHPSLLKEGRKSVLLWVLNLIERRLNTACEVKLPELRKETDHLIRRAQGLIRHLASISFEEVGGSHSINSIAKCFASLSADQIEEVLSNPSSRFATMSVGMINPDRVRVSPPKKRKPVTMELETPGEADPDSIREAYIKRKLSEVFSIDDSRITDFVVDQLASGRKINSHQFNITTAQSLLGALHAASVASVSHGKDSGFRINQIDGKVDNEYYEGDAFEIEYIPEKKGNPL